MIPLGCITRRCHDGGLERTTQFTKDEQVTLMSLWALAPSPLMLGMNLPENDAWTQSLLTNTEVLAVNQDALGQQGVRISQINGTEIWTKALAGGATAIGLFNRGSATDSPCATVRVSLPKLGFTGTCHVRDLWKNQDLGTISGEFSRGIPPHGAILLRVQPEKQP
jgi:hypothetical protein